MGVLRFENKTKEPYLASYHSGVKPQFIKENMGFELNTSKAVETEKPTEEEIYIIRNTVDPEGIFLR